MVLLAVCFLCQNCVNSEFDESLQDNNQASPYLNQPRGYRPEYVAPNPPIYPNPGQYSGQYPSQMPPSRYYSNPYAIPNQQNPYGRYDYDQYYVAPKYYYNTEPEQRFDNMRRY